MGAVKHGNSKRGEVDPVYKVWLAMRQRCNNPKHKDYQWYGARGITVDPTWDSFAQFAADMGPRPDGYELDRERNHEGYHPGNCRWVPGIVNRNNTRNNKMLTFDGRTQSIADWARETGIKAQKIVDRTGKLGWSVEDALTLTRPGRNVRPKLPTVKRLTRSR